MQRLWAPWRMAYLEEATHEDDHCVFCLAAGAESPDERRGRLVLQHAGDVLVVMNKYPYNNGHLLVMPAAHVSHFHELDEAVTAALHVRLLEAVGHLERAIAPHGVNIGMNLGKSAGAGIPGHIHYHVVPRWEGDTNFMPVIGETKVISQHVLETYDRLKPYFDGTGG